MTADDMARRLVHSMDMLARLHMQKLDLPMLSKGEFRMMVSIAECGGCEGGVMASDLSARQDISKPAISQTVRILEKKGLVERTPDKLDRRVVRICVTRQGKNVLQEARGSMLRLVGLVVDKLGEEDTQSLIGLVDRLHAVLADIYREEKKEGGSAT